MKKLIFIFLGILTFSYTANAQKDDTAKRVKYSYQKTDAEWKEILTSDQYHILRQAGTERPHSSPLNKIHEEGTFHCAGCNTPLYESKHKFASGTGWPSFDRAVKDNIDYDTDHKVGYARTELLCMTCGGHLGHMFNDGPAATTGKRHCINGDALIFTPKTSK